MPASGSRLPITVLIMAQNEEVNIGHALESVVPTFDQVIVTDSQSQDGTLAVVARFPGVEVHHHAFAGWAEQRMWMMQNCAIRHEIVLFLDADEQVSPELAEELARLLAAGARFDSIWLLPVNIFLERPLRFAYGHPKVRRVFRREWVRFRGEGAREYSDRTPREIVARSPLWHHDRKPLSSWVSKHLSNADREARLILARKAASAASHRADARLSGRIRLKLFVRERIWNHLPLFVRPWLYFFYRYGIQGGFLDGRAGLVYCVLHALWYPLMVDARILELGRQERQQAG